MSVREHARTRRGTASNGSTLRGRSSRGLGGTAAEHRAEPPAPRPSLAEQAYDGIKRLIFDFALMPEERLSESELSQRFAVSRTPLRQALQRLAHEGFVRVVPKVGWQVAPLDFRVFDELYDLRVLIECHAAQRLAYAADRPSLRALADAWLVSAGERLPNGDRVSRLDERFHATLVESSGNRTMARVHHEITERIRIVRRLDFTKSARVDTTYDEHARILRAIARRRADEAQRLLRAHIEQSKLEVRQISLEVLYERRQR